MDYRPHFTRAFERRGRIRRRDRHQANHGKAKHFAVKKSLTIDSAAMAGLAFLLLIFFVLGTRLNRPHILAVKLGAAVESAMTATAGATANRFLLLVSASGRLYAKFNGNKAARIVPEDVKALIERLNARRQPFVAVVKVHREAMYEQWIAALDELSRVKVVAAYEEWTRDEQEEIQRLEENNQPVEGTALALAE